MMALGVVAALPNEATNATIDLRSAAVPAWRPTTSTPSCATGSPRGIRRRPSRAYSPP